MQNERATKKQQELLGFVDGFIKSNGYGPSYREIMRALDYKSVSTVAIHIDGLIAKGYLARRDKSARSLEVITSRVPGSSEIPNDDTEARLIKKIQTVELRAEHKATVKQAMELLGFAKAAEHIELESGDDEQTTNS